MQNVLRTIIHAIIGVTVLSSLSGQVMAKALSPVDRAHLQATMFKDIHRQLVDGAYLHFDLNEFKVDRLYPSKAHPMVLEMGEHYVLCTDFKTKTGKSVNVDFYAARNGKSFVIFKTAIDKRNVVHKLVQAGKAKLLK